MAIYEEGGEAHFRAIYAEIRVTRWTANLSTGISLSKPAVIDQRSGERRGTGGVRLAELDCLIYVMPLPSAHFTAAARATLKNAASCFGFLAGVRPACGRHWV
jgi:hypothetical protein